MGGLIKYLCDISTYSKKSILFYVRYQQKMIKHNLFLINYDFKLIYINSVMFLCKLITKIIIIIIIINLCWRYLLKKPFITINQ